MIRRPVLPHHEETERPVTTWEADGIRYRLVERGGIYRAEAWHLYRWEPAGLEALQVLARHIDGLTAQGVPVVLPMRRERRG